MLTDQEISKIAFAVASVIKPATVHPSGLPSDWLTVAEMCEAMKIDRSTFDRYYLRQMSFLFRPNGPGSSYRARRDKFDAFRRDVEAGKIDLNNDLKRGRIGAR